MPVPGLGLIRSVGPVHEEIAYEDHGHQGDETDQPFHCLLYTSDAADERSSVDLGGRRIIKKKNKQVTKHTTKTQ